jgi:hypothetical protein
LCGVGITLNCANCPPPEQLAPEYSATSACEKSQLIHLFSVVFAAQPGIAADGAKAAPPLNFALGTVFSALSAVLMLMRKIASMISPRHWSSATMSTSISDLRAVRMCIFSRQNPDGGGLRFVYPLILFRQWPQQPSQSLDVSPPLCVGRISSQ